MQSTMPSAFDLGARDACPPRAPHAIRGAGGGPKRMRIGPPRLETTAVGHPGRPQWIPHALSLGNTQPKSATAHYVGVHACMHCVGPGRPEIWSNSPTGLVGGRGWLLEPPPMFGSCTSSPPMFGSCTLVHARTRACCARGLNT